MARKVLPIPEVDDPEYCRNIRGRFPPRAARGVRYGLSQIRYVFGHMPPMEVAFISKEHSQFSVAQRSLSQTLWAEIPSVDHHITQRYLCLEGAPW